MLNNGSGKQNVKKCKRRSCKKKKNIWLQQKQIFCQTYTTKTPKQLRIIMRIYVCLRMLTQVYASLRIITQFYACLRIITHSYAGLRGFTYVLRIITHNYADLRGFWKKH